jgi:hypothetical protein
VVLAGAIAGPYSSGTPSKPVSPAVLVAVVVVVVAAVVVDDALELDGLLLLPELPPQAARARAASTASKGVIQVRIAGETVACPGAERR